MLRSESIGQVATGKLDVAGTGAPEIGKFSWEEQRAPLIMAPPSEALFCRYPCARARQAFWEGGGFV